MEKISYFKAPTQVKFWESEISDYMGGIAYKDEIICGHCGSPLLILSIIDEAPEGVTPIIPYQDWIDIAEEITGE